MSEESCFVVTALSREPMQMALAIQELIAEGRKRASERGLATRPLYFKIFDSNGNLYKALEYDLKAGWRETASGPGVSDPLYLRVLDNSGSGKMVEGRLEVQGWKPT